MCSLGKGIKRAREKRGLTQRELAELLGIATATVSNWEQGDAVPRVNTLTFLCELLECDMDYLFYRIDHPTHDIDFICQDTGLSEESVVRLMRYKRNSDIAMSQGRGRSSWTKYLTAINSLIEAAQDYPERGSEEYEQYQKTMKEHDMTKPFHENELLMDIYDYLFTEYDIFFVDDDELEVSDIPLPKSIKDGQGSIKVGSAKYGSNTILHAEQIKDIKILNMKEHLDEMRKKHIDEEF